MKSKLSRNVTILGVGTVALGLLGVWLMPQRPANGQERPVAQGTTVIDYADGTYGSKIRHLRKPDGHEHNLYYHRNPWNADRSYMLVVHSDLEQKNWRVVLHDDNGRFIKELFAIDKYDWRLVWDRNAPAILYAWKGSNLYRYNVNTGKADLLKSFAPSGIGVSGPSLNESGDRILVITTDKTFHSYRLPDMQAERTFKVMFPPGCSSDWEDERYIGYRNYIAVGCYSKDLSQVHTYIYDDTGQLFHDFEGYGFGHTDFSPDGKWAYFKVKGIGKGTDRKENWAEVHLVNLDGSDDQLLYNIPAEKSVEVQNFHISWPDKVKDWFVVGFFPRPGRGVPTHYEPPLDEILQIRKNGRYKFLARSGTTGGTRATFWQQTLPSPSADGSRISFNSNRSGTIDEYILFVPDQ